MNLNLTNPISQSQMRKTKTKCVECKNKLINFQIKCQICDKNAHKKCVTKNVPFICTPCSIKNFPFNKINNSEFLSTLENKNLSNLPSFRIQSLIDSFDRDENEAFISETVNSKYYTPKEFNEKEFGNKSFSILHLNIASLSLHLDELKTLLATLNVEFDIITLTEIKYKSTHKNIINHEIENYNSFFTPSHTFCGGTLIYIKDKYPAKVMNKYTKSEEGLFESTFVEIKNGNKSLIIGTIYRHPTAACNMFLEDFLHPILHELDQKRKKVVITGDFNFDMIKYNTHKPTSDFYDLLSSFSYKPLILDPSRITYKSNTLIDNIFVNDIGCISEGGNITSSISDHYLQFSINDMFGKTPKKKTTSYKRNFKNFKINEFVEELYKIDLINITANGTNIN